MLIHKAVFYVLPFFEMIIIHFFGFSTVISVIHWCAFGQNSIPGFKLITTVLSLNNQLLPMDDQQRRTPAKKLNETRAVFGSEKFLDQKTFRIRWVFGRESFSD